MQETSLHFYYFKIRLIVQVLLFFPFMIGSYYIAYIGFTELSLYPILLGLFTSILVSCVWGAAVLKLFRNKPYVTITNTYIRLDPQTKSEVTLYYDDIKFIDISEASFQKLIKIYVYDEKTLFKQLSLHNKIRLGPNALFGFKTFSIAYNFIRKRDRPQLLATLDKIMAYKRNQTSENLIINDINHEPVDSQQYYMERYGLEPPTALIIDKDYFKKAFGYSAFIFLIMFILFYVLLDFTNGYLSYIIVSFFTFPFAKVLIDWMGVYKLR